MQSSLRRISNTPEAKQSLSPSLSGDGRIVAFESTEDLAHGGGGESFRAIQANVSVDPPTLLQMAGTRGPASAISQDGSRIAFAATDNPLGTNSDFNSEIFLYDGAKLIQVTNTSPGPLGDRATNGNFRPSISDDGRYIAFSSNRQLTAGNADGNFEVFIYDTINVNFAQVTNSAAVAGSTDAKISGDGSEIAYIHEDAAAPGASRRLLQINRSGLTPARVLASDTLSLALTYGRAISDDGQRVVWSANTAADASQVFVFDRRNNITRQLTQLGPRSSDVPLHPSISGDGSRVSFATRRPALPGNSDNSIEVYTFDIPSGQLARVTNAPAAADGFDGSRREVEVITSLDDDGSHVAFNFPRALSGVVANADFANHSEIYIAETSPRPIAGELTVLNGASLGHEPAATSAIAPDSVAIARGSSLSFRTEQSQPLKGIFPTVVAGTTVKVNGRSALVFFASPTQVNFRVPATTEPGVAEVEVMNSDGFQSRATVAVLAGAPGIFTAMGDGLGDGVILDADTMLAGPFDPTGGNLRLIVFCTGLRNATTTSLTAAGRALAVESITANQNLPGMDEVHVLVPADLRGAGRVELSVQADGRESNVVIVEFSGDASRDVLINEFLADPPDGAAGDANHDGVRDSGDDEFIELVNTTSHDIDLAGYRILTRSDSAASDTVRHEFVSGSIIPACTSIVVFGGGNPDFRDPVFGGAQVFKSKTGSLSLNNSGGLISLTDRSGATASSVAYGSSTGLNADANQSHTRAPDLGGHFALHQAANGSAGRLYSAGTKLDGTPFSLCSPITRIGVSPATASITVGQQQQFTARAFDASGNELTGVIFLWSSSDLTVARVDQNGVASAATTGTTEIRASGRGVQSAPASLTVNSAIPPNVFINEVDSDQAGTDTREFVELYDGGDGNTPLSGLVLVFYNGSDDKSYAAFDLDFFRTNANGYFTLGSATVPGVDYSFPDGTMQNGADAVAVYVGNAADFPNGTPIKTINLIDALVYDTNDADDVGLLALLNPDQPQVNEDTAGEGEFNSNQRCPNGSGGPRNTSNYRQFPPTPDAANICVVITPPPAISINDVSANEGNAGTTNFVFTVSLSAPATAGGVNFDIATADSTATVANSDYQMKSLSSQTIAAGNQSYQFTVAVNGDTAIEPNESFLIYLSNVTGATIGDGQGTGTVQNDDSPTLSIDDVSATEGDSGSTTFTFTITSSAPAPAGGISFDIATADDSAQDHDPATEDNDYTARNLSSQIIPAGNSSYRFEVAVKGDRLVEPEEAFVVNLTNSVGATVADGQGRGAIQNDDIALLTISQIYAGGGNTGSQYTHDFVEIFNRGVTTINFAATPFSVQYAGATGSFGSSKVELRSGSMAPGKYYLVQLSSGGANGAPLPVPDAAGTIAMAATGGKVALVAGVSPLDGSGCPIAPTVVDFVGYGNTADCFEGSGRAPAPSNTTSDLRRSGGCTDVNDNLSDFFASAPIPRNSSAPVNDCLAGMPPSLSINDVTVAEGNNGTTTATFTVSLSTPAPGTDIAFDIATQDQTATVANNDYVAKALTAQLIPAGQQTYTFTININGDTAVESNETFFVNITNISGAMLADSRGLGTIQNDDLPVLTISDVNASEGNAGPKLFSFTLNLSAPAPADISFDIATADVTAQDGNLAGEDNDYAARALTGQMIPAGTKTYIFEVIVNGDLAIEPDETFLVNVTNVSGASTGNVHGVGTIKNDDTPALSIDDVSANETNGGATTFTFTVTSTLPAPADGISFDIGTADGSAQDHNPVTEDNDYAAKSLTGQTIAAGNKTYTFAVSVNGDMSVEANETFFVNLTNVVNANISDNQGLGTIQNDDMSQLVISQIYGGGNNSGATFQNDFVELFNRGTTTVNFAVTPYSLQYASAAGSFTAGNKLDLTSGALAPGQYFLIRLAGGTTNGVALPPADATGTLNMSATDGKVALVSGTSLISGSGCPINTAAVLDFVGYGSANCAEAGATGTLSATRSARRINSCSDTNVNSNDFAVVTNPAAPRNSSTALAPCP